VQPEERIDRWSKRSVSGLYVRIAEEQARKTAKKKKKK
jgi:hypothetical protein